MLSCYSYSPLKTLQEKEFCFSMSIENFGKLPSKINVWMRVLRGWNGGEKMRRREKSTLGFWASVLIMSFMLRWVETFKGFKVDPKIFSWFRLASGWRHLLMQILSDFFITLAIDSSVGVCERLILKIFFELNVTQLPYCPQVLISVIQSEPQRPTPSY